MSEVLGSAVAADDRDTVQVIVHQSSGGAIGLVVDSIVDIVDERVAIQRRGARSGVIGSAVVQGRVTEIVDAAAIVRMAGVDSESVEAMA